MAMTKRSEPGARADVLIAGGGFAGLALAVALRQALGDTFQVTVADPALGRSHAGDARASAIAAAARRLFEAIGVWEEVAGEAQPILDMVVTDSRLQDVMRPSYLTFGGEVAPGEPFAHMIENPMLVDALVRRAKVDGVQLAAAAVTSFEASADRVDITLSNGETISAKLLVAADGARSAIRETAGIRCVGWSYDQAGIVTTVAHERDHQGRAEEHFLPAGPFAILPLKGHRSSIVWTEERREAARIIALPDNEFHAELEKRFATQQLRHIACKTRRLADEQALQRRRTFDQAEAHVADQAQRIG
jgi:2-octaprenyl-6-methoxyphenol hydroxylase